jgi:DNA-directed RNA polymerase subunit RPC12/RpoP
MAPKKSATKAAAAKKRSPTPTAKTGSPAPAAATDDLVCERCGRHNPPESTECSECHSKRFAKPWVRELRRVNRAFSVQVTNPHPQSDSTDPPLTLYKWWPGNSASFNIPTQQQWERVKAIVDGELAPFLGWEIPPRVVDGPSGARTKPVKSTSISVTQLQSLANTEPLQFTRILKQIDFSKVTDNDVDQIAEALGEIAESLVGADEGLRRAIRTIVAQLPQQGEAAVRELSALMESLTLTQIATVTREVQRRLGLLELFRDRALDDRTYEIRGDGSIHRLLESAMWIVDERYWLMHSNQSLRTIVGTQMAKEDKQFERQRPDFVCGTVDRRLIIIELKRPSHVLDVADLNQLERYVVLCGEYSDQHSSFEALLVGTKQSDDLRKTLKVRSSNFRVRTYTDLINDTERRYKKYLEATAEGSSQ